MTMKIIDITAMKPLGYGFAVSSGGKAVNIRGIFNDDAKSLRTEINFWARTDKTKPEFVEQINLLLKELAEKQYELRVVHCPEDTPQDYEDTFSTASPISLDDFLIANNLPIENDYEDYYLKVFIPGLFSCSYGSDMFGLICKEDIAPIVRPHIAALNGISPEALEDSEVAEKTQTSIEMAKNRFKPT